MKFIVKDIEEGTFGSGNPITEDKLFQFDSDKGAIYSVFTKDENGLVPAPTGDTLTRYLREDGTWTTLEFLPPVQNINDPYEDTSDMFLNQSIQKKGYLQKITGDEKLYLYLGTVAGDITDYQIVGGIKEISIRNTNDVEQFKISEKLLVQGASFDATTKKITVLPLTPLTVYIHTVTGSDITGEITNSVRPFKTFTAALAATPVDGLIWTYEFIDNNVTRTLTDNFPKRSIIIQCFTTGIFILDSADNNLGDNTFLGINMPKCTLRFQGVQRNLGVGFGGYLKITVFRLEMLTNEAGFGGTIVATTSSVKAPDSLVEVSELLWNVTGVNTSGALCSFKGKVIVKNKMTIQAGWVRTIGNSSGETTVDIKELELLISIRNLFEGIYPPYFKLQKLSGTGTLNFGKFNNTPVILDFSNLIIAPTSGGILIPEDRRAPVTVTGIITDPGDKFFVLGDNDHKGGFLIFDNFTGRLGSLHVGASDGTTKFINSNITIQDYLFNDGGRTSEVPYTEEVIFEGVNTVTTLLDPPDTLCINITRPFDIKMRGVLQTNTTGIGAKATATYETVSFKEKKNEIIIRSKKDIVNRVLDSNISYIIDGDIALDEGEFIIVPVGGLTLLGYSFDSSRLGSYGVRNHHIFKTELTNTLTNKLGSSYTATHEYTARYGMPGLLGGKSYFLDDFAYLQIPVDPYLDMCYAKIDNAYSIGVWFKTDGLSQRPDAHANNTGMEAILFNGQTMGASNLGLYIDGTRKLRAKMNRTTSMFNHTIISELVTEDTWHYAEIKWNGSMASVFYDGNTVTIPVDLETGRMRSSGNFLHVGRGLPSIRGSYVYEWRGYIDRLFVYTRARTEAESLASWNNGLSIPFASEPVTGMSAYYDMEDIPIGGSGNLVIHNIAFTATGIGSGVFDIKDIDGSHALEMVTVNFEGCKSIGHYDGYRQGTGITIGFYGCSDGLYFSGANSGFKLTNTNGFSFGANGCLFRSWRQVTFSGRFYLEVNLDLLDTARISDFSTETFLSDKLFQINTTLAKIGGVLNPELATDKFFPNITPEDPEALFTDNVGLKNTSDKPYGIGTENMKVVSNDSAAANAGVPIGGAYVESGTGYLKVRTV